MPGVLLATALVVAAAPALFFVAAVVDVLERRRARFVRFTALLLLYLVAETIGLVCAAALWLARPLLGAARYLDANFRLQRHWAGNLLRVGLAILGMRMHFVAEAPLRGDRPLLVFVRHVSIIDTLLPNALIASRYGMRLRYVIKDELRFDPCLDIVGGRLPVIFVRRGSNDPEREAAHITQLGEHLEPGEAVLLFPEGTRGGPAGRQRALARLEQRGDEERLAFARRLENLLPPRSRGPLALLAAAPQADVLFVCHAGLEGSVSFAELLTGRLIGRTLRMHTRIVATETLPGEPEQQRAWLDAEWQRMDRELTHILESEDEHG